jgi:hypothetical protein
LALAHDHPSSGSSSGGGWGSSRSGGATARVEQSQRRRWRQHAKEFRPEPRGDDLHGTAPARRAAGEIDEEPKTEVKLEDETANELGMCDSGNTDGWSL